MDKPDKGETLFSVVFVSIVIGEIAVVGAALWRASGWKLLFVVMALLSDALEIADSTGNAFVYKGGRLMGVVLSCDKYAEVSKGK